MEKLSSFTCNLNADLLFLEYWPEVWESFPFIPGFLTHSLKTSSFLQASTSGSPLLNMMTFLNPNSKGMKAWGDGPVVRVQCARASTLRTPHMHMRKYTHTHYRWKMEKGKKAHDLLLSSLSYSSWKLPKCTAVTFCPNFKEMGLELPSVSIFIILYY